MATVSAYSSSRSLPRLPWMTEHETVGEIIPFLLKLPLVMVSITAIETLTKIILNAHLNKKNNLKGSQIESPEIKMLKLRYKLSMAVCGKLEFFNLLPM